MTDHVILENIYGLTIRSGMKLEHIIAQLQPLLSKEILCVKNNDTIFIYHNRNEFPIGLKLEKVVDDIFYIRSIIDDDTYAIAGKEIAAILFPNITNGGVRCSSVNNMGTVTSEISKNSSKASIKKLPLI